MSVTRYSTKLASQITNYTAAGIEFTTFELTATNPSRWGGVEHANYIVTRAVDPQTHKTEWRFNYAHRRGQPAVAKRCIDLTNALYLGAQDVLGG